MGQLDVDSGTWSSGAGIIDSFNILADEIRSTHDKDTGAVAASIGLSVVTAGLDIVSVGLDPLSKLIAAGLGWLIEHVQFLREPLDLLAGNPAAVADIAAQLHTHAQELRNISLDLGDNAYGTLTRWQGPAAENFGSTAAEHQARLEAAGKSIDTVGYVVETDMAVIVALRTLIRDMTTSVLGDIISTMLVAMALAVVTFGASVVVGIAKCVAFAVEEVTNMLAKISRVLSLAGRSAGRIDELVHSMGQLVSQGVGDLRATRPVDRAIQPAETTPAGTGALLYGKGFHDDGLDDGVYRDWLNFDGHLNADTTRPGTSSAAGTRLPNDAGAKVDKPLPQLPVDKPLPSVPARPAAKPSPFKKFEVPLLNKHQPWLQKNGFGDAQAKTKFVDSWVKTHYPEGYPYIKAISDAKSSKNYVGLGVKAATTVGKQLTDIQQQAEDAWQVTNEKWQLERDAPLAALMPNGTWARESPGTVDS